MNGMSHVVGGAAPPLLSATIGDMLDRAAARAPDAEALVVKHQDIRYTWSDLKIRAEEFGEGLIRLGLDPGDRVAIWAPNCAEWAIVQFATAKAGLILVTINPAYRAREMAYALKKAGCKALVTAPSFKTSNYVELLSEAAPELALCEPGALRAAAFPELRSVITLGAGRHKGCIAFDDVARPRPGAALIAFPAIDPDDAVNIQFTSGTTGFPKGATLSHRNILNNGYFVGAQMRLSPHDRLCIPVPLYHCFGMVMGNLACLVHGATMIYPGEAFDAETVLRAIEEEHCTALYGVPTMFIAMLGHDHFDSYDLSSLRTGIMAGSPCPVATMRQVIDRMGMDEVTIAYGMTETSPVSFQTAMDDPVKERVETVGRILPHLESKVVDSAGAIVSCGEIGELCVRGYSVMIGYWEEPERTSEAIDAEGWMHTGDLAALDERGYCRIVGRIKDMVIRGGENIYPREVEEFLMTLPAIADAQVFGVPDDKFGEEICAWIRLKVGHSLNEAALLNSCKGQIAHYKIPRHIRFVSEYPMTVTGKIQKFAMREQMMQEMADAKSCDKTEFGP